MNERSSTNPTKAMSARILFITAFAVIAPQTASLRCAFAEPYSSTVLYAMAIPSGPQTYVPKGGTAGQIIVSGGDYLVGNLVQYPHALLWSANGIMTDLTPGGPGHADNGGVIATDGIRQVGDIEYAGEQRAAVWSGTASSVIILPSSGNLSESQALGVSGSQIVGYVNTSAALWTNTSSNPVLLNPAQGGFSGSFALGTDGIHQVGLGSVPQLQGGLGAPGGSVREALLWSGTASSAVNLQPSGFTNSEAFAVSGNQQVGYGTKLTGVSSTAHAIVWSGTAASAVDLNPAGFAYSEAQATNGVQQVGISKVTSASATTNAFLWSGSAASAVNLQSLLPSTGVWNTSNAYSIDALGNVFGVATGNFDNFSGTFAVEWSPELVPGDFNQDGSVTTSDIQAMMNALVDIEDYKTKYGLTDAELLTIGDLDHSGSLTNADVEALISKLASAPTGQSELTAVPEPDSCVLMVVGAVGILAFRAERWRLFPPMSLVVSRKSLSESPIRSHSAEKPFHLVCLLAASIRQVDDRFGGAALPDI